MTKKPSKAIIDWDADDKPIVKELTPELADKIWNDIQRRRYDDKVSKDAVLHHLKQLKAQMGKELASSVHAKYISAIKKCMQMVDNKIKKVEAK